MSEAGSGPVLVISAHAGDFVWRAAGAMALAASPGDQVTVLCLSDGERGESARAWLDGKKLEEIQAIRRAAASNAADDRVASLRLQAGKLMGLGNVGDASVLKTTLVSAPAGWRRDLHRDLHSGPAACLDRRARRHHRRRRAAGWRRRRRASGVRIRRAFHRHRAPDRTPRGGGGPRHPGKPAASAQRGRDPHRPQALRRSRVPQPNTPE